MRSIIGLLLLAGTVLAPGGAARAAEASLSEICPTYRTSLAAAQEFLAEGDQKHALDALRRAREILAGCIRDAGGETALVAVSRPPREG